MHALPTLYAEPILTNSFFSFTNTYFFTSLILLGICLFAYFLNRSIKKHNKTPRGLANFAESIVEVLLSYSDKVTGDRKKSIKFLPLAGSIFIFIVLSNWLGLLPGIGTITIGNGHEVVPLLRSPNTDLNLTVAMALVSVLASHIIGFASVGFVAYSNKFIKVKDLFFALKSLKPDKIMVAVIEFFVGFIEIFSEIAKVLSLSLRLFGNVFAGEVLLTVLASIFAFILPLPFMGLELLVGIVQASVFAILVLVYLTISTTEPAHAH